ncbi:PPOX class F420-dependent oxidoreductase [Nocardioides sp. GY 10127]|uniref:PPOX class F420-dependent oxidoreductase n=1 Tax=Nocardioides sp. GY 10127 TaxID=2569762 RepID=UPI0010A944A7|nr:PPOX class F420-dependent oxidoreductase [Nocardioides sp. GY 10127]TIC81563.1 PPOX class F420-dependent oxidoreductase [Nocardioides sp. GY 10127]
MDLTQALTAARGTHQSVLVTVRGSNGRPQLSNVMHAVGEDGLVRVSITADRAKYANLRRTPWAALHVAAGSFWSYAVLEGDVSLSEVVAEPDDAAAEESVALYRAIAGEHEDWDAYRAALVTDRRLVVHLSPTHAYGMLR